MVQSAALATVRVGGAKSNAATRTVPAGSPRSYAVEDLPGRRCRVACASEFAGGRRSTTATRRRRPSAGPLDFASLTLMLKASQRPDSGTRA